MINYVSKPTSNRKSQAAFFGGYNLALKNIKEKIENLKSDYTLMGMCLGVENPEFIDKYKEKIDTCKSILSIIEKQKILCVSKKQN